METFGLHSHTGVLMACARPPLCNPRCPPPGAQKATTKTNSGSVKNALLAPTSLERACGRAPVPAAAVRRSFLPPGEVIAFESKFCEDPRAGQKLCASPNHNASKLLASTRRCGPRKTRSMLPLAHLRLRSSTPPREAVLMRRPESTASVGRCAGGRRTPRSNQRRT
jgi:hypothetical protein